MCHVRRASVRDLHVRTSELVREASQGNVIVIERRGRPVVELRPLSARPILSAQRKSRLLASMSKLWARLPRVGDSAAIIGEDRTR